VTRSAHFCPESTAEFINSALREHLDRLGRRHSAVAGGVYWNRYETNTVHVASFGRVPWDDDEFSVVVTTWTESGRFHLSVHLSEDLGGALATLDAFEFDDSEASRSKLIRFLVGIEDVTIEQLVHGGRTKA
jgi:hypothetical protein